MFFSISKQKLGNFPVNIHCHKFWINLDPGWTVEHRHDFTVIFKGYADDFNLKSNIDKILEQSQPNFLGNFCVLKISQSAVEMFTDLYRSFPVFFDRHEQLTNLWCTAQSYTCWTDSIVKLTSEFELEENKFDVIGPMQLDATMNLDHAINQIIEILDLKVQKLINNHDQPIKVFLSGGIDTTLIYSFLKKHKADIELVRGQFFEYDRFWLQNHGDIKKFWGYQQFHHFITPTILASGAPGDEFMLRSPVSIDLWIKHHGINMMDLLHMDHWKDCLHYDYFLLDKHKKIFQTQALPDHNVVWSICNILVNDWQHWHLGNTLTWTPLRDLAITKILLSLPIEQSLPQIMNSDISKQIIERNVPGLCKIISDSKNSKNYLSNLVGLIA